METYGQFSTAQANTIQPPRETTISSLIEQIDNQLNRVRHIVDTSRALGDRLHGVEPSPLNKASQNGLAGAEPSSLIIRLQHRVSEFDVLLNTVENQLSRVDRAL